MITYVRLANDGKGQSTIAVSMDKTMWLTVYSRPSSSNIPSEQIIEWVELPPAPPAEEIRVMSYLDEDKEEPEINERGRE